MAIQDLLSNDTLVLAVALVIFIAIGYKVLTVLKNAVIIAVLAAVFPFFLNEFFGTHLATSLNAELLYVIAGIGLYILYEAMVMGIKAGEILWRLTKLIAKPFVWISDAIKRLLGMGKKENKEKSNNS